MNVNGRSERQICKVSVEIKASFGLNFDGSKRKQALDYVVKNILEQPDNSTMVKWFIKRDVKDVNDLLHWQQQYLYMQILQGLQYDDSNLILAFQKFIAHLRDHKEFEGTQLEDWTSLSLGAFRDFRNTYRV